MTTPIPFGTRLIGQTEKTLNAILHRLLADSELSEPQWVALSVSITASQGTVDEAATRVSAALKSTTADAGRRLGELCEHGLLAVSADGAQLTVTAAGHAFHRRIRHTIEQLTERLWGDIPAEQLDAASEVLNLVLERADTELATL